MRSDNDSLQDLYSTLATLAALNTQIFDRTLLISLFENLPCCSSYTISGIGPESQLTSPGQGYPHPMSRQMDNYAEISSTSYTVT